MRKRPRGETVAFGKLVILLSMMKGSPLIPFQIDIIEDRTAHIPIQVLARGVAALVDAGGYRPDIEGILGACERARLELRGELKFEKCENCSAGGWTEREIDGVKRAVRCSCWAAHQQRVAALGAGDTPLALPAGRETGFEQVSE